MFIHNKIGFNLLIDTICQTQMHRFASNFKTFKNENIVCTSHLFDKPNVKRY